MDELYRESLRQTRQKTSLNHPLITSKWSYTASKLKQAKRESKVVTAERENSISSVTEKIKTLDSINVFENKPKAVETLDLVGESPKPTGNTQNFERIIRADILEQYTQSFGAEFVSYKKDSFEHNLDVLFITDEECLEHIESPAETPRVFTSYFNEQIAQLFYKMTKAMELSAEKFFITSVSLNGTDDSNRLFSEIVEYKPRLIMSLGANAYQLLTQSSTRLKDTHGQFIDISLKDSSETYGVKLMPIFSPKLLHTAPNMKKTTWTDMQKAMEYLKS